jgi:hypothetical protein
MSTTYKIQWQTCPKQNSSKYEMTAWKCMMLNVIYCIVNGRIKFCAGYDCLNLLFQNPTVGVIKFQASHISCPFHPFQTQNTCDGQNILYISQHHKTLAFESHTARILRSLATLPMFSVFISAIKNVSHNILMTLLFRIGVQYSLKMYLW